MMNNIYDSDTKSKTTPDWEQDTAGQLTLTLARVTLVSNSKRYHNATNNVELKNLAR